MLKYEHRIGFDLGVFLPGFIFIFVRLWIRNRNRLPNPPLTWILSDVFVSFSLIIAASVISLDIWYMRREIGLRNYPKEDNPLGYFLEAAKISVEFLKVSLFNQYAYVCALWSIKASFLCSYYTMAQALSSRIRMTMKLTWVALAMSLLGLIFAFTFWCRPIERNWTLDEKLWCSPQAKPAQAVLVYVLHIGTDIPIMAIPFFIIHTLKLGRGERYAISFMFLLGFMTVVISTFSFVLHLQFIQLEHNRLFGSPRDALDEKLEGIYLSAVAEVCGAVFVVCLPSIRLAFRILLNRVRSTTTTQKSRGSAMFGDNNDDTYTSGEIELGSKVVSNGGGFYTSKDPAGELPQYANSAPAQQRQNQTSSPYSAGAYDSSFDFEDAKSRPHAI